MATKRVIALVVVMIASIGCGSQREQRAYKHAVTYVKDRIAAIEKNNGTSEDDELARKYCLPLLYKAMITLDGMDDRKLKSPIVVSAILRRVDQVSENQPRYNVMLDWLESGRTMTGFFFELSDGTVLDFPEVCDPNLQHFIDISKDGWAERYIAITFWQTGECDAVLTEEQRRKIIDNREVIRAGLILKDGTKTEAIPVLYTY